MAEKTRSIVDVMFAALADQYSRDPVYTLLNTQTNVTPEDVMRGKIVVLNSLSDIYFEPGRLAQFHFKNSFQRSVLQGRQPNADGEVTPVVLWCDEAYNFISDLDLRFFFAEARSNKSIGVYLEQGISLWQLVRASRQQRQGRGRFLTNLQTKLFFPKQFAAE